VNKKPDLTILARNDNAIFLIDRSIRSSTGGRKWNHR